MDLSKVKLIATDMDGTLLNSKHEVSDDFFELFNQIKSHGILFVAASGRPYYSMIDKLSKIKDDIIIVSENGGLGIKNEELFLSNPIDGDNFKEIYDLASGIKDAHAVFCARNKAYVLSDSQKLLELLKEYYPKYNVVSNPLQITEPIYKVALFHEVSSERFIYPFVKHIEKRFKVKVSANHWVDISENKANKGHAISLIQENYNITTAETMVFGDYKNDIEMLKLAKFSFAMQNAHPDVKAVANFETKSNDENGVEYILKQTIEAKKAAIKTF
ncbi:HAD family hydrolase [Lacinutrix sp. Bg11-31]|uniref:HAD family hydrolase n=1 Tax=Lacinutrix sp. Bg11-31 TaxID=2057808 RepID=UPI000C318040|nr:HAD family hydrolase [Lacinutrix sp. Bg11-31]AUC81979.1 Cof-type HAD-IIB family hydrolase [Lacinutrix sp. Bg11-31]